MSSRPTAAELIDLLLDPGTLTSWDTPIDLGEVDPHYRADLDRAAARSGSDESVLTGSGSIQGRPVAFVVNDFRFLAGSIGRASADRIIVAVRRATAEGLPVLAATASGGTRMQEGTPAFIRMIDIARAIMDHRAAGLPYLAYLRHPTTGGVFASWGSLAHITIAEPEALIGFLGPKVYETLNGQQFPADVQTSENLASRGVIDGVVAPKNLPQLVDDALRILLDPPDEPQGTPRPPAESARRSRWASIELTRDPARPGVRELLRHGSEVWIPLSGTEKGERDSSVLVALARIDGQPCVVIGQDRTAQRTRALGPAALRQARRGMKLAEELRLPLVSVVDTPGAELSPAAEEGALAGEIARCIATLSTLTVPTLAVISGQGCGGGALAMLAAQSRMALENAWLSPLPPEGASAIVYGDAAHAQEMADSQRVGAFDLLTAGIVDEVIPEHPDDDEVTVSRALAAAISARLSRVG